MKMVKNNREKDYWSQITFEYMTEESEDEENDVVRTHKLSWTSNSKKYRMLLLLSHSQIICFLIFGWGKGFGDLVAELL